MPDPNPQSPGAAKPKKETVRITLPPKPGDVPLVSRETVRIDVNKGETMKVDLPPAAPTPKKESTKIAPLISGSAAGVSTPPKPGVPAAPVAPKAFVPPPSALKAPGGLPTPPRPPGTPGAPPSLGAKPSLPLKPAPPGAVPVAPASAVPPAPAAPMAPAPAIPSAPAAPLAPPPGVAKLPPAPAVKPSAPGSMEAAVAKAATPKKETSRISVTPEPKKMPQATVKLQPAQPLAQAAAPSLRPAGALPSSSDDADSDALATVFSALALVASLAAAGVAYWAFSSF